MTNNSCEDGFFLQISSLELGGPVHSLPPLPPPATAMTGVRDFVAGLARAGKSFDEIKETTDLAFGDKILHNIPHY